MSTGSFFTWLNGAEFLSRVLETQERLGITDGAYDLYGNVPFRQLFFVHVTYHTLPF